jgi:glycosyltransferase involved in cell wall biosynthesis
MRPDATRFVVMTRPLRLLIVNWQDRLNPRAGGAEIHLHEIFGRLVRRGHQVTLLCSGWSGAPAREEVDGIEVHRVGGRHSFALRARRYHALRLRDRGFDLLIEDLNKIPLNTPRWGGAPVVLLVHHLFGATAFRSASPPVAAATWLLERNIPRWYRGIPTHAVSESTAADLVRRGLEREDIRVITNGVALDYFTPLAEMRSPDPLLLYLGRLQRYKRVDLPLRALTRLRAQGMGVRLVIAGRGPDAARLERLAERLGVSRWVEFAGFVSEEHKRELFRSAWVHLLTSPKEGWGITNLEAAACATPTVASDAPGLRDSVQPGVSGELVPHGDVEALASSLHGLLTDGERLTALRTGARAFAERFSWEHSAQATEADLLRLRDGD